MDILVTLDSQLAHVLDKWDGGLDTFEEIVPNTINSYCHLNYKDEFVLNKPKYVNKVISEHELGVMEARVINVIKSMTHSRSEFYLMDVLQMVDEKNKDLVIIGIEGIIEKKLIIPFRE